MRDAKSKRGGIGIGIGSLLVSETMDSLMVIGSTKPSSPPPNNIAFSLSKSKVSGLMEEVQIQVVVESLLNGESSREARIEGAREVAKLSSKQRHKLGEAGLIPPLVSMLYSQDYQSIQPALFALLTLAFGSERNKMRIVKCGAVPVLLELVQCQNEELTELTVAALLTLTSCNKNKLAIASSGAIQVLVNHILSDTNSSTVTMMDAIATLHNLSTCHQIIPSLVSSGVTAALLHQMSCCEKSSPLVEKAMGLLECIVASSEDALEEAGGSIGPLVETVEEGMQQSKEHAARILLLICRSSRETYRGLMLREGIVPGLMQLSVDGTRRAKTTATKLLLLLRDGSGSTTSNQTNYQLMEQIMQEIDAQDSSTTSVGLRMVEDMIAKLTT